MSKNTVTFLDRRRKFKIEDSQRVVDSNGFLHIKNNKLTRTGVFKYKARELGDIASHLDPEMVVGLLRSEEDVFDPKSIESFDNVVVTDNHPPEMVNPRNVKDYSQGFVVKGVRRDGNYMVGDVHITDQNLITKVLDGKVELSNGYYSDLVDEVGEYQGEPYHFRQTNIIGNHLAVVPKGRAGVTCRLSDAAMCVEDINDKEVDMKPITFTDAEGVEATVVLDGCEQDVIDYIAYLTRQQKALEDEKAFLEEEKQRVVQDYKDQLQAEEEAKKLLEEKVGVQDASIVEGTEKISSLTDSLAEKEVALSDLTTLKDSLQEVVDNMDFLVEERVGLSLIAKELIKDHSTVGKSNTDIKREIIKVRVPTVDSDTASVETLDALLKAIDSGALKSQKASNTLRNALNDSLGDVGEKKRTPTPTKPAWMYVRDKLNDK